MTDEAQLIIDKQWTSKQLERNLTRVLSPAVCRQALDALGDPNADFLQLATILQGDPFVAAKVVGMANLVVREGRGATVQSIDRAVRVLGTRNVHMLVLSVMLAGPLLSLDENVPRRVDLWRWVLACGLAGDWLAGAATDAGPTHEDTQEPEQDTTGHMVSGLLLGLGCLVLHAGLGAAYTKALGTKLRPMSLSQREQKHLGVTHHRVTLWALESMSCPKEMGQLSAALDRADDKSTGLYARAVEVMGAKIAGFESGKAEAWLIDALPRIGMDPSGLLDGDMRDLRRRLREIAKVFQVDLGDWRGQKDDYQEVLLAAGSAMQSLMVDNLKMADSEGVKTEASEAHTDTLTGAVEHAGWEKALAKLSNENDRVGLMLVDVDGMEKLNNRLGRANGDRVLKTVAQALGAATPGPLLVGRFDGDKFVAIFPVSTTGQLSEARDAIVAYLNRGEATIMGQQVSVSFGGVLTDSQTLKQNWSDTYRTAQERLDQAQRQGANASVLEG